MSHHGAGERAHREKAEPHAHHGSASVEESIARLEDPERAAWQKPDELVAALGLREGDQVLDLGTGPGYLALRFARAVGTRGHVFAADADAGMLAVLLERRREAGVANVTPLLVPPDDPTLPAGSVDLAFLCNTYHHVDHRVAFLRRLRRCLAAGGRLAIVDFHKRELPLGPPMEMKIDRDVVVAELEEAGFRLVTELTMLPYQYGLVVDR